MAIETGNIAADVAFGMMSRTFHDASIWSPWSGFHFATGGRFLRETEPEARPDPEPHIEHGDGGRMEAIIADIDRFVKAEAGVLATNLVHRLAQKEGYIVKDVEPLANRIRIKVEDRVRKSVERAGKREFYKPGAGVEQSIAEAIEDTERYSEARSAAQGGK